MVDSLEMSLDEIIRSSKSMRRGRGNRRGGGGPSRGTGARRGGVFRRSGGMQRPRGRGGIARPYTRGDVNSTWKHDLFEGFGPRAKLAAARSLTTALGTTKLMVGNLDFGVSDSDIQELFAEFGPLKNASVHYDRSGRSLGTADVIFERRTDAIKAMKQYNGVPLDGRPMNIQIITSEIPLQSPQAGMAPARRGKFPPSNANRAPRGKGGNRGRGGRFVRTQRKIPTAEELDAELDAYTKEMK